MEMNESLCCLRVRTIFKKSNNNMVVLRAKRLGIPPESTKRLSLERLKAIAKNNFRKKVKKLHPDHVRQDSTHFDFRHLVESYHYLMDLESKAIEEPMIYYPLPWDWDNDKGLLIPKGWQRVEG